MYVLYRELKTFDHLESYVTQNELSVIYSNVAISWAIHDQNLDESIDISNKTTTNISAADFCRSVDLGQYFSHNQQTFHQQYAIERMKTKIGDFRKVYQQLANQKSKDGYFALLMFCLCPYTTRFFRGLFGENPPDQVFTNPDMDYIISNQMEIGTNKPTLMVSVLYHFSQLSDLPMLLWEINAKQEFVLDLYQHNGQYQGILTATPLVEKEIVRGKQPVGEGQPPFGEAFLAAWNEKQEEGTTEFWQEAEEISLPLQLEKEEPVAAYASSSAESGTLGTYPEVLLPTEETGTMGTYPEVLLPTEEQSYPYIHGGSRSEEILGESARLQEDVENLEEMFHDIVSEDTSLADLAKEMGIFFPEEPAEERWSYENEVFTTEPAISPEENKAVDQLLEDIDLPLPEGEVPVAVGQVAVKRMLNDIAPVLPPMDAVNMPRDTLSKSLDLLDTMEELVSYLKRNYPSEDPICRDLLESMTVAIHTLYNTLSPSTEQ